MSAERVAVIPQCEECRKVWLRAEGERRRAYWIDDGPTLRQIARQFGLTVG